MQIHINLTALAKALELSDESIQSWYRDGRAIAPVLEMKVAAMLGGTRENGQKAWDVIANGRKVEVRAMIKHVSFIPNINVGGNRDFNKQKFIDKLEIVDDYAVCAPRPGGLVDVYIVPSTQVRDWWYEGQLKKGRLTRRKFFTLLKHKPLFAWDKQ